MQATRHELRHAAVRTMKHLSLAADVEDAVVGEPLVGREFGGAGGIKPPSYQVMRTGGRSPRAGKS